MSVVKDSICMSYGRNVIIYYQQERIDIFHFHKRDKKKNSLNS